MIRAGIIGTGNIAAVHLKYLSARADVTINALCDTDERSLAEKTSQYGGKGYRDFRMMLDDGGLDAVWLCTPTTVRYEPLIACAERGIPVFCEKPAARNQEEASRINADLAKLHARVQTGYLFRSLPSVQRLREELSRDRIHAVQSLYVCGISLKRLSRDWFYDKDLSGGALVDQATHNLDLLRFLFGEVKEIAGWAANPVKAKEAGYTIDETIVLSLLFHNDITASHSHSWVGDRWRINIGMSGETGFYRIDLIRGILKIDREGETLVFRQEERSKYEWENEVFLKQVITGRWNDNPSSYPDACRSLKLTLDCDKVISS